MPSRWLAVRPTPRRSESPSQAGRSALTCPPIEVRASRGGSMRRGLAAGALLCIPVALAGSASAQRILGAGRDRVALRWEPASGSVAYYEVTCTVDGVADVLVGTTSEPRLEITRVPAGWGERIAACSVRAFD